MVKDGVEGHRFGKMDLIMKDIGLMIRQMEKAVSFIKMGTYI
jgi:hypothetical protein